METFKSFEESLYNVNDLNFEDIALSLFRFQAKHNEIYAQFIHHLGVSIETIDKITKIPFLPISFFKTHSIQTGIWKPEVVFTSSGEIKSRHPVKNQRFYLNHAEGIFAGSFGQLSQYHIMALLPSYLERQGSSLVSMVSHFIKQSDSLLSSFYLKDFERLVEKIERAKGSRRILVLGVSFALLSLAEQFDLDLSNEVVIETGGMKGRRDEMIREDLHQFLKQRFNISDVSSEYGMTELMSQAYSTGKSIFRPPSCMKVLIRDINDPKAYTHHGRPGGINVIDLANIHSCAFIETQDLGKVYEDGSFKVMGRLNNSDMRGCNLMLS